jgi:nicotinate-nucleotide adenylyltransferase
MPVAIIPSSRSTAIFIARVAITRRAAAKEHQLRIRRVGIYAGTFDPIHAGHLAFALQALSTAKLDAIYFLPERRPRHKEGVEHFGHRVAMLRQALQPHPQFRVLELTDISLSVEHTLPRLQKEFPGADLVFLFGSDVLPQLSSWPKVERLLQQGELVIGMRDQDDLDQTKRLIEQLPRQPISATVFASYAPHVSSGKVRAALRRRAKADGLLTSVQRYSDHNWLYISLAQ